MTSHHCFFVISRFRIFPVLILCVLLAAFGAGCSSRVGTGAIRADLASDNLKGLEQDLEDTHESFGEFVTALNLARVYQVNGRWKDSIKAFEDALVLLEDYESRAVINMRALLADTGVVLFSRGANEYFGAGYERSLLHTFNALNYLMLGDFPGAAVEMRRMDKRQEIWLEESQARIEKYLESERRVESPDELPVGYSMRELLRDREVRGLLNNYQDPFSYSLGAVLYRLAGDFRSADVSMRRAIALDDQAGEMFARAWPGKTSARKKTDRPVPPAVPVFSPALSPNAENTAKGDANVPDAQEVTVIAFSGLAPALRVENVRVFAPAIGYLLIDLPSYTRPISGGKPTVAVEGADREITPHPLLRTSMLAYRTLWDELRMEITFAMTRALARAGIAAGTYAAASSNKDTREYAPLAATLATVIMDLFSSAMSESVRNWETLPDTGYLAMGHVARGGTVTVGAGGNRQTVTLPRHVRGVIIMATEPANSNLKVRYVTY